MEQAVRLVKRDAQVQNNKWSMANSMNQKNSMTLQDIIEKIYVINEDIEVYERKYGILSETFYESYLKGEEIEDDVWVMDWSDLASAYKILLRRQE